MQTIVKLIIRFEPYNRSISLHLSVKLLLDTLKLNCIMMSFLDIINPRIPIMPIIANRIKLVAHKQWEQFFIDL